jgi:hypothetical protein
VRQLRKEQADHVAPRLEGAASLLDPVLQGQGSHQVVGNQIAQLPQEREPAACWLAGFCFLHDLPCGRSNIRKPTSLFRLINPVGRLCNYLYWGMGSTYGGGGMYGEGGTFGSEGGAIATQAWYFAQQ